METFDFINDKEHNPDAKRGAIGDPTNWPAEEVEEPGQTQGVSGPMNSQEDAMIAKIDAENAEKRKKGGEHQAN